MSHFDIFRHPHLAPAALSGAVRSRARPPPGAPVAAVVWVLEPFDVAQAKLLGFQKVPKLWIYWILDDVI